jgi:predicted nucleic acid-binding protein
MEEGAPVAVTGVVITEILQGLKRDVQRVEDYLSLFDFLEAKGFETYRNAGALFRLARSRGVSLTTIDSIIAAIAVENGAAVFSLDRDFLRMAHLASLQLHQPS